MSRPSPADFLRRIAALEYTVAKLAALAGVEVVPPPVEDPEGFERVWEAYPRRAGGNPKPLALKQFRKRVKEGVDPNALYDAVIAYARHCRDEGKEGTEFVMQASTFLGPNGRWSDFYGKPDAPDADLDDLLELSAMERS